LTDNCWTDSRQPNIPDDVDVFRHLAKLYSFTHPTMNLGRPCPGDFRGFSDGITSGSAWYLVTGHYSSFVCVKSYDVTDAAEVRFHQMQILQINLCGCGCRLLTR